LKIVAIDIGNSGLKIGFFGDDINDLEVSCYKRGENIPKIKAELTVISSVSDSLKDKILENIKSDKIFEIYPENISSVKFDYSPLSSLGRDRVAAALGAFKLYGGDSIIVDFGTAITVDYVNEKGEFWGGMIFPGPLTILECLANKTEKVKVKEFYPQTENGKNTIGSVNSAITNAILGMIERKIREHSPKHIIFTGGYYEDFIPFFKDIKIIQDKWLVLRGLYLYAKERLG